MKSQIQSLLNFFHKRPEYAFVLIALPFGLFSAIFVPQMSVTDENSHLTRAYQVARGQVVCRKATVYPQDIIDKSKSGSAATRLYTNDFSEKIDESDQRTYTCGSAAGYSPVGYLPQAVGVAVSELIQPTTGAMVLFGRIANLLAYILIGYWIIRKVLVAKYVFLVILLIPQMIHLAASLSADMMNNIVTLAIFALILNLFIQTVKISRNQIMALIVLVTMAALLKVSLFFILLPLLFLPARLFRNNKSDKIPFNVTKWLLGCITLIAAGSAYLLWSNISQITSSMVGGVPNPIEDKPTLFFNLLFNTYLSDYGDLVLRGIFGEFSSFLYHFPTILIIFQILLLLVVYLYDSGANILLHKVRKNKWFIYSSTSAFVISILAITYGLYTAWGLKRGITLYADGVQGRYFTALLILLIPMFAWISKYVSIKAKSDKHLFVVIVFGQLIVLSFYALFTMKTITDI